MTVRGPEDRSLRKSPDRFSVLGPWLTTRDEIPDPNDLRMSLLVNGALRQQATTRDLIFDVQRLIEFASTFYRLYPGDLIYTGTPEGVGPVVAGDVMTCTIDGLGAMTVAVNRPVLTRTGSGNGMMLENDYSRLPGSLYTRTDPVPVAAPRLIKFNESLAAELRLELDRANRGLARRRFSVATSDCPVANPLPWPTPAINSGTSCRAWATAGLCCWAKRGITTEYSRTSS